MHLLHALPGALFRRPPLPAHDSGTAEAREARSAVVSLDAQRRQGPEHDHYRRRQTSWSAARRSHHPIINLTAQEAIMSDNENGKSVSRRTLLGTTAAAAGVGLAGGVGLSSDGRGLVTSADAQTKAAPKAPAARPAVHKTEVAPGDLDEYYVF